MVNHGYNDNYVLANNECRESWGLLFRSSTQRVSSTGERIQLVEALIEAPLKFLRFAIRASIYEPWQQAEHRSNFLICTEFSTHGGYLPAVS